MRVFTEDGKLSEQKGWIDKKIIERIVGWLTGHYSLSDHYICK
jgi:hypothetical protein